MSDKIEVARTVADHLFKTEEAIDQAIACAAGLAGYMPLARQQLQVSAAVGQPAMEQVVAAMAMLADARRMMVEAHQSLAETSRQARIPAHNFGGFVDKPPPSKASATLHTVADSKAA
jgi:hypothetical protein